MKKQTQVEANEDRRIYAAVALLGLVIRDPRQIVNHNALADEAVTIGNEVALALARNPL